jgi:hypothetical protein
MAMNHDPDTSRWVIPRPQEKHLFVTIIDAKSGRMIYKYKHNDYNINMVDWYPDSSGVLCLRKEGDEAVVTKLAVK